MKKFDLRINYLLTKEEQKILSELSQIEVFNTLSNRLEKYRNYNYPFGSENGLPQYDIELVLSKNEKQYLIDVGQFKFIGENYVECIISGVTSWDIPF